MNEEIDNNIICLFSSTQNKPLQNWDYKVENGYIKKLNDEEIKSPIIEIFSSTAENTFITTPKESNDKLKIKLPLISLVLKNIERYFSLEVLILDDNNIKRLFKASNNNKNAHVKNNSCNIPLKLVKGWNLITFNMSDLTRKAYGTNFVEIHRVVLHANCHLRRILISSSNLKEDQIPIEERLIQQC